MDADVVKINMDITRILEICREIELSFADLYRYYAGLFSGHEELATLWRKTAAEEENHAKQFGLAISLQRQQVIDAASIDGFTAKNSLHIVRSVHEGVKKHLPTMLEALSSAIKLEENLTEFHVTTAVHFVDTCHQQLFAAMMRADSKHVEALQEFRQRLVAASVLVFAVPASSGLEE